MKATFPWNLRCCFYMCQFSLHKTEWEQLWWRQHNSQVAEFSFSTENAASLPLNRPGCSCVLYSAVIHSTTSAAHFRSDFLLRCCQCEARILMLGHRSDVSNTMVPNSSQVECFAAALLTKCDLVMHIKSRTSSLWAVFVLRIRTQDGFEFACHDSVGYRVRIENSRSCVVF